MVANGLSAEPEMTNSKLLLKNASAFAGEPTKCAGEQAHVASNIVNGAGCEQSFHCQQLVDLQRLALAEIPETNIGVE